MWARQMVTVEESQWKRIVRKETGAPEIIGALFIPVDQAR
jgi:hypothetical protein